MQSSSMLTKNSSEAQRRHPWTRVSWSDVDSLDEEEVQEVESITLGGGGGAPPPEPTQPAVVAAVAASDSVVIAPAENEDTRIQQQQSSVTLKPFQFNTNTGVESGSLLSPFVLNNNNDSTSATNSGVSATTPTIINQQDNDTSEILVSQKGHLITPAVTDAVSAEDNETSPAPALPKRTTTWKSFWTTTAQLSNNEEKDKDVVNEIVKTTPAAEDKTVVNEEQTCLDLLGAGEEPELNDDDDDILEEEEVEEDAPTNTRLSSRCLEAVTTLQEMAKGWYVWVVDACLMEFWAKLVSIGILLNTWFRNGVNSFKSSYETSTNKIITAWESSSSSSSSSLMMPGCLFFLLVVVGYLLAPTSTKKRTPSPTNDLRDFVRYEKAHNVVDLAQIDDLNTEAFRTYARSTCVEAATFEQARSALDMGLYGVPDTIRSTIVPMAIMEGVTQKNSIQDSNNDFVNNGKADAFMAFWSTVYDPRGKAASSSSAAADEGTGDIMAYKTCVMVTGVALTVAETVAEWTTKTEQYQIGTEPCHCGYLYCEECPVFDVREVKWPVFERRSLSLRKQEELRRWMVDQAVKSAEHLVLDGSDNLALESGGGSASSSSLTKRQASFSWTGPTSSAYFGEDSHNDNVVRSSTTASSTSSVGEEL